MKATNISIAFALIMILIMTPLMTKRYTTTKMVELSDNYQDMLDDSVEDCVLNCTQKKANSNVFNDRDEVFNSFLMSMYANFDVLQDGQKQVNLQERVPIFALIDNDGIDINYGLYQQVKIGKAEYARAWSEKYPFSYTSSKGSGKWVWSFRLGDSQKLLDTKNNKVYSGTFEQIFTKIGISATRDAFYDLFDTTITPHPIQKSEVEDCKRFKNNTIMSIIERKMTYYINKQNEQRDSLGKTFRFSMPVMDSTSWSSALESPGVFAVFNETMTSGSASNNYTITEFAMAKAVRFGRYVIIRDPSSGLFYYHKMSCEHVSDISGRRTVKEEMKYEDDKNFTGNDHYYYADSKIEAAEHGAYACPYCKP
jgi:hypothetical protein